MADDPLFTLKQLADELNLPESTVRYYRDAFLDHIPSVGTGRRRRYPAQAIAVLRSIAKQYSSGKSRSEIAGAISEGGGHPAAVQLSDQAPKTRSLEEVSNLDLLAAILDGEREQRDALWQMAKEIVRLTDVLEGQDKVLNEIADRAGVTVTGQPALAAPRKEAPRLGAATATPAAPAPLPPPTPAAEPQIFTPPPFERETAPLTAALFGGSALDLNPAPAAPAPPPAPEPAPAARADGSHEDISRLQAELESERALVERLRESKLQLEHRVADAEADLEDKRRERRPSVLKRLLRSDIPE